MKPLALPAVSAVALALLATGCSGGSGSGSRGSGKDTAPTRAQAQATVKAINLTKADAPSGFTSTPVTGSGDSDKEIPRSIATCLGVDAKVLDGTADIVEQRSDSLDKGQPPAGISITSDVEVVATKAEAKKTLDTYRGAKALDCIKGAVEASLKTEIQKSAGGIKVDVGTVTVTRIDPDSGGTDGSFGVTIKLPLSASGIDIPVQIDLLAFAKDHTEVSLNVTSFGSPLSDSDRDALYAKLVGRAKTAAV